MRRRKRTLIAGALAGLAVLLSALTVWWPIPIRLLFGELRSESATAPVFVGSETCAGCHHEQVQLWSSSQHKHAMQHANDTTVLGNFNDATFDYYGIRSRVFRQDGKFLVETDGPDGKLATFDVKYTFWVDPLQQYLVEFSDGRLQALSIAW